MAIQTAFITVRPGEEIIVAKLPSGAVKSRWEALKIITAVRAAGPLEKIAFEVVVMAGEPDGAPLLIGTKPEAEEIARAHLAILRSARWQLLQIQGA